MNNCSKCGKELAEGTAFCMSCGTPVSAEIQIKPTITIGLDEAEFQAVIAEKVFHSTHGTDKTFPLNGKELHITADMDAFNEYRLNFRNIAKLCADTAAREYTAKVNNLETFLDYFPEIYLKYLDIMGDKAIDIFISESIFSITREEFLEQHKADFHLAIDDIENMAESIQLTIKKNRAVSGTIQSLASKYLSSSVGISEEDLNAFTDGLLDEAAQHLSDAQKAELYGRVKPHMLFSRVFCDYWNVFLSLVFKLREFGHNLWWPDNVVFENSKNIFKNISNPNFPQDKVCDVLFAIIHASPYNSKYYEFMQTKFGDTEEVTNIRTYFGFPDFGEDIYTEDDIPKNEIPVAVPQTTASQNQANNNTTTDTLKSGANMLKNVFKNAGGALTAFAIGAALKGSGGSKKGTGRRDLFGSHLCNYGHKDENGWTIHCGLQCPVHNQCTQRGRYKEGS